jgi:hypothetical protein
VSRSVGFSEVNVTGDSRLVVAVLRSASLSFCMRHPWAHDFHLGLPRLVWSCSTLANVCSMKSWGVCCGSVKERV